MKREVITVQSGPAFTFWLCSTEHTRHQNFVLMNSPVPFHWNKLNVLFIILYLIISITLYVNVKYWIINESHSITKCKGGRVISVEVWQMEKTLQAASEYQTSENALNTSTSKRHSSEGFHVYFENLNSKARANKLSSPPPHSTVYGWSQLTAFAWANPVFTAEPQSAWARPGLARLGWICAINLPQILAQPPLSSRGCPWPRWTGHILQGSAAFLLFRFYRTEYHLTWYYV